MYLVRTADAVGQAAIHRAVEGLIPGLFIQGHSNIRPLWEDVWPRNFERYAELCIQGAFAGNLPEVDEDGIPLSKLLFREMVQRAVRATYDLRTQLALEGRFISSTGLSQISLECRWMLEGFLGLDQHSDSKAYSPSQWNVGLPKEKDHLAYLTRLAEVSEEFEELKQLSNSDADDELKAQVMAEMVRQIEEGIATTKQRLRQPR